MSENTQVANVVPGLGALAAGLKRTKQALPTFGQKGFLKFAKDGDWVIGKENDVCSDDVVIFNINAVAAGFTSWTDYDKADLKANGGKNKNVGEEMRPTTQEALTLADLPDTGWDWKQQLSIQGRFVEGDKSEFTYTTSSLGGIEAIDSVLDQVLERVGKGEDVYLFPMVKLVGGEWYTHTTWGKTYKPMFEVVGWADFEGNPEGDSTQDAIEDHGDGTVEEETAADEVAPVRRRRR